MRGLSTLVGLFVATIASIPPSAHAQVPSAVDPVPECRDITLSIDASELARFAARGDWVQLQRTLRTLLGEPEAGRSSAVAPPSPATASGKTLKDCLTQLDKRVIFVFAARNAFDEWSLYSVIYPTDQPFEELLPGLSGTDANSPQLYEVFVTDRPRTKLQSVYAATRQENPLTAQAVGAVSGNVAAVLTGVGALAGSLGSGKLIPSLDSLAIDDTKVLELAKSSSPEVLMMMRGETGGVAKERLQRMRGLDAESLRTELKNQEPGPVAYASVASVRLSLNRAKVEVTRRAYLPKTLADLELEVTKLVADIQVREALNQPKAVQFAGQLDGYVTAGVGECETGEQERAAALLGSGRGLTAIRRELEAVTIDCRPFIAKRLADDYFKLSDDDRKIVETTYTRLRAFVADLAPFKIDQKGTLLNEPKERVAFTVLTGFAFAASKNTRVKADGGVIVSDPLPRVLTAVGVHIAKKYQPSLQETMKGPAIFAGVVLTPNIGFALGGSWRVVKGLAFSVGWALLAAPTGVLGDPAPTTGSPFKSSAFNVGFAGMSFSLK